MMHEHSVAEYIVGTFAGVETTEAYGYTFFFHGADRMLPFATLAASDNEHDRVSDLDRPGVYRLNVGVSRDTYRSLLGDGAPRLGPNGIVDTGDDFTALDRILPHPHYAPQSWVCVLSPGEETWRTVQRLLAEAYERAAERTARKQASEPAESAKSADRAEG